MADPNSVGAFLENMTSHMLAVIIALAGFWTTFIRNLVNRSEVEKMIQDCVVNQSQYSKDRQYIMERLDSCKESQVQFAQALQRNTEVMNELKVQIATLGNTLENLENRIENNFRAR